MNIRNAWRALWAAPEYRQSAAGTLIARTRIGQAVFTQRRVDRLAEEGYRKNVIAYRAISEVARGVACVPWQLFRQTQSDRTEIETHPLLELIDHPNPMQGRSEFFEAVTAYFLIAGNSYIEAVGPERSGAPPRELWTLRPDRMAVVPGITGLPQAYEYQVGGEIRRWDADPVTGLSLVRHLKAFHPLDDFYGLSPIEAAAMSIDQHNEQARWNVALLQNAAEPSGALVYSPKQEGASDTLTDEQFEKLSAQLERDYTGSRNARKPLLLEGGLDWKQMGFSPRDMDFMNTKNVSARDIAQAFGVPSQLLGIPGDNTYSNYQEARLALWEETIVPFLRHLRDELNTWLAPMFEEGLELEPDLDEIPALVARRETKRTQVREDIRAGLITINEGREELGLGPVENGDAILVPANLLPLGGLPDEDLPPVGGTDEESARHLHLVAYGDDPQDAERHRKAS